MFFIHLCIHLQEGPGKPRQASRQAGRPMRQPTGGGMPAQTSAREVGAQLASQASQLGQANPRPGQPSPAHDAKHATMPAKAKPGLSQLLVSMRAETFFYTRRCWIKNKSETYK